MLRETRATKVLDALRIRYVVKGRRAWARCPYHEDADPSWFVDVFKTGHHCFSCKAGGTLAELVVHVRGCSLKEAIEFVSAQGKGFEPPRARVRFVERPARPQAHRFRLPREVYVEPFEKWPTPMRRYAERRHLDAEQAWRFRVGYAVDGRLEGRIVLPVLDLAGRVLGYSARDVTDASEQRYLTPHEKDGANLDGLFGEHLWPKGIEADGRRSEVVVVAEGALNALAVDRALGGAIPVASIGGSDARPGHAAKLAAFRRVILLTDPDDAGDRVANDLGRMLLRYCDVVRPRLPEDQDADTLPRSDLRAFLLPHVARRGA